jgi:hypothetical protein
VTRIEAIEKLEMFLSAMISEFGTSERGEQGWRDEFIEALRALDVTDAEIDEAEVQR